MKLLYVGGGFVGACSAAVSADSGHEVLVYDTNYSLIKKLSSYSKDLIETSLYEDGLGDMILKNKNRIRFVNELKSEKNFIDDVDAIFMCVPTPENNNGETNLTYYDNACNDISSVLLKRNNEKQEKYVLIVNKSTVPIYMVNRTSDILKNLGVKNFGVGSNPEFLVEGKAVKDSVKPDRIVVGAWSEKDFHIFRDIYKRFYESMDVSYIEVNPVEAAAGKLLANYILFSKLMNCFDIVGRTCEKFKFMQFENVRKILATDKRIGGWGLYNSMFAGGSCLIKDSKSLAFHLNSAGEEADLVKNSLKANESQINKFLNRPRKELNFNWEGKTIGLLGLSFKRDTNDIRYSPALITTEFLIDQKVDTIKVYDPVARSKYFQHFSDQKKEEIIILPNSEKDVIKNSDVIIICTDWPQFRELYSDILELLPKGALIMDGRRMLQSKYQLLGEQGYNIIAVGSPLIKAKKNEQKG